MEPRIAAVMRTRYWTTCILRVVALLMVAWGTLQSIGAGFQAVREAVHFSAYLPFLDLIWPLRWIFLAGLLIMLEQRLVRWLFPLPRQDCPQCNYPIAGRPLGACPECGLVFQPDETSRLAAPPGYPRSS